MGVGNDLRYKPKNNVWLSRTAIKEMVAVISALLCAITIVTIVTKGRVQETMKCVQLKFKWEKVSKH